MLNTFSLYVWSAMLDDVTNKIGPRLTTTIQDGGSMAGKCNFDREFLII